MLGAEVIPVTSGTQTLKDATNQAIRDWVTNVEDTHYIIGSVVGPHPYPTMVRDFQRIIGDELREQIMEKEKRLPDYLVACVGGGSNAMGMFFPFVKDQDVKMIGVEAAGRGLETEQHAASITAGRIGVLHGSKSFVLQDDDGQITPAYSISAGLDYPGVGPEHSYLHTIERVRYESITDIEAVAAFKLLARIEGIIPALESSHALAYVCKLAPELPKEDIIVINLSGRGDKDIDTFKKVRESESR
jgi:tryptophan synthase beta chain